MKLHEYKVRFIPLEKTWNLTSHNYSLQTNLLTQTASKSEVESIIVLANTKEEIIKNIVGTIISIDLIN